VESSARHQQVAQKRAAEQSGQQDAAREKTRAELDALTKVERAKAQERDEIDSAAEEVDDAVENHLTAVQGASRARAEADRIRRQADKLTNQADLP
jgi:hypothetical protein